MWGASSLGIPSLGMSQESEITGRKGLLEGKCSVKIYINKEYNNVNHNMKYIYYIIANFFHLHCSKNMLKTKTTSKGEYLCFTLNAESIKRQEKPAYINYSFFI